MGACLIRSRMRARRELRGRFKVFEVARVLVRLDHVASRIVKANLPGFGHASESPMHHEQYRRSMKAPETAAMLVERAQRLMCESRKLLEQREAQLRQQEQFLEQRATIAHEMLRDTAIRATAP